MTVVTRKHHITSETIVCSFRLYMFLALVFLCLLMLTKALVGNGAYGFSTKWCLLEFMA
jgi:hypothetical protein